MNLRVWAWNNHAVMSLLVPLLQEAFQFYNKKNDFL